MSATTQGRPSNSDTVLRLLPKRFSPSVNEVIIGRGRKVTNHSGNERFRDMVYSEIKEYSAAENKTAKSSIIFRVLQQIKNGSPETGGFVKRDSKTKRWYTVEDTTARTTTAQAFRDALSSSYKSSKQFKQQRRWDKRSAAASTTTNPQEVLATTERGEVLILPRLPTPPTIEQPPPQPSSTSCSGTAPVVAILPKFPPIMSSIPPVSPSRSMMSPATPTSSTSPTSVANLVVVDNSTTTSPPPPLPPRGLGDILDSALETANQDYDINNAPHIISRSNSSSSIPTNPPVPSSSFEAAAAAVSEEDFHVDLESLWDTLVGTTGGAAVTANPFEPTPILSSTDTLNDCDTNCSRGSCWNSMDNNNTNVVAAGFTLREALTSFCRQHHG